MDGTPLPLALYSPLSSGVSLAVALPRRSEQCLLEWLSFLKPSQPMLPTLCLTYVQQHSPFACSHTHFLSVKHECGAMSTTGVYASADQSTCTV